MPFGPFKFKRTSFEVAIGEEGIVVIYVENSVVKSKVFVRSTDQADTEKLRTLLLSDVAAQLNIYIDTLDQTYVQRSIPAVSAVGVYKVANNRLEKEVPKNHFKGCTLIGRATTGRKDWIFTFFSTPIEAPLSTWLDFFLPFPNIIRGIYFMPLEMYSIVYRLKLKAIAENAFQITKKKFSFISLLPFLGAGQSSDKARWEVLFTHDKSGGYRQVAFQDGKIIFSRLLNSINDPSPVVVAGNIEQEISNSIEYMTRLSLGSDQDIDVYLVLAKETIDNIRKEKIKATNLFAYTPYELSQRLGAIDSATEKDKFADPTILDALSAMPKVYRLHTPVTATVYRYTLATRTFGFFLLSLIPFMIIASLYFANLIIDIRSSIETVQTQVLNYTGQLQEQKKSLQITEAKINDVLKSDHIIEIVTSYDFFKKYNRTPITEIGKAAAVLPEYARIKTYTWEYKNNVLEPQLVDAKKPSLSQVQLSNLKDAKPTEAFIISFDITLKKVGNTYEELESRYTEIINLISGAYTDYAITFSDLPTNFTLGELNKTVTVTVRLAYPKTATAIKKGSATTPQPGKTQQPLSGSGFGFGTTPGVQP